jgi:Arrestin (or S-antigen), C-terminal domain
VKKALVETKIPEGERHSFKFNLKLPVPDVMPTDFTSSRTIHQRYTVVVRALVSGVLFDPCVTFPITIGTIPLRE